MTGVIIRILLRYAAATLVARGLLTPDDGSVFAADPDLAMMIETGLGFAMGAAAEGWYYLARRFGWSK